MSAIWPHFNKKNPCPACNHSDWNCRMGDKKFICMRIASEHPAKDGGFYHEYGEKKPAYIPPKRSAPKVNLDFDGMMKRYNFSVCEKLALNLGVSEKSLCDLNAFWIPEYNSWAIPMRDGENKIIGIHLRCDDGTKRAVVGSRNGLFIPSNVGELIERNKLSKT